MQRGPKKSSKFCDLREIVKFLYMFRKTPKNVYQLYHSKLHFGTKKIYRYLCYCLKTELLEIDHIFNQIYLDKQTPLTKLFTTPRFTEASAKASLEIPERKVMTLQRVIKRTCEHETFTPLIQQAGFEPKIANCRLNWGTKKPQTPYIRPKKVRKLSQSWFLVMGKHVRKEVKVWD